MPALYYHSLASLLYLPTFTRTPIIPLHSLPSAPLTSLPWHPLSSPTLPYPTLYPTLTYPPDSGPYPSILSLPYLPLHPYTTLAFPTLRSPRIPSTRLPSPPLASPPLSPLPCCLPYHIPPDWSRGRKVSFPTSLGYLNPSLPYPPLPYRPNTPLPYATHLLPTFPLLYPRIPSTPLISSVLIPYPTVPSPLLPYPLLPSPLFSHLPLYPPLAYPTLLSPPVYPALPKDSDEDKGQDVLVPECIGAEIVWCKTFFGGLK